MSDRVPHVVVLGATATGKTALAIELARALPAEVVSFDASCVYRGLDVGTAKPTGEIRERVPHHLVDVAAPDEEFSVARFVELAELAVAAIAARGGRPLLVGGTGLYLRAYLRGLVASPVEPTLRERLERRALTRPASLHRILSRLDGAMARRLEPADHVRIIRALEHRLLTGRSLSEDASEWSQARERHPAVKLGLALPRAERERRIRARIDAMLADGLLDEVRTLLDAGVPETARSLRALGYREAVAHLRGRISRDELRERTAIRTRQYAKRQDTWFRREPGVTWLPAPRTQRELPGLVDRAMIAIRQSEPR